MGEVINMTSVRPKTEAHSYHGHRYVLSFNPQAEIEHRWQWSVKFTRVYEFAGSMPTLKDAQKAAKQKIDSMIDRSERVG